MQSSTRECGQTSASGIFYYILENHSEFTETPCSAIAIDIGTDFEVVIFGFQPILLWA
jgi:hypothetical protein